MRVAALAGGVGGAKLAHGLAALCRSDLTVIVNTGDDFEHLGLHVSPDVDTVMYTLAGIANPMTGWGVVEESWDFLGQVQRLGGPDWFRLGDKDLAVHVLRTEALRTGKRLTEVTARFCERLGIRPRILPMSDSPVRTMVDTAEGALEFQDYFVRRQCNVAVRGFFYDGIEAARASPEVENAVDQAELIVLCPSNPFVSLAPILSLSGLRERLAKGQAPVIAVSPIIGSAAVKGPAAKMMTELGLNPSALTVAGQYRDFLDGMLIDETDAALSSDIEALGIAVQVASILMLSDADRVALAQICLEYGRRLP